MNGIKSLSDNKIHFTPICSTDEITLEFENKIAEEWMKVLRDILPSETYKKRKQEKFIVNYYNNNIKKVS